MFKKTQATHHVAPSSLAGPKARRSKPNPIEAKASQLKRKDLQKLAANPDLSKIEQVLIFDIDETVLAGDKHPIDDKREQEINKMGDREVVRIKADDPRNTFGEEIVYVLRPGVRELLEYLTARGYGIIFSTRNLGKRAEVIVNTDPVLSKHSLGVLGMEDLLSDLNKDFDKYPHHPDKLTGWRWLKASSHTAFVYAPWYVFAKLKSTFTGEHIRWSPVAGGILGKYPPAMLDLLEARLKAKKAAGETLTSREANILRQIKTLPISRILVDNQAAENGKEGRELIDSRVSGDWAIVDPDVDRGSGNPTDFLDLSIEPKIKLKNKKTGEVTEGYQWVKQVIESIESGWQAHFKKTTGLEPIVDSKDPKTSSKTSQAA